jgi:heme exporter protein C
MTYFCVQVFNEYVLKNLYKIFAVILVMYSVLMGLLIPTGPGLKNIKNNKLVANSGGLIEAEGYNAAFSNEDIPKVWLKIGGKLVEAEEVSCPTNTSIKAKIPPFPVAVDSTTYRAASILVEDNKNGLFADVQSMRIVFEPDTLAPDSLVDMGMKPQNLSKTYMSFPLRNVLYETVRNLNFHVPMWFAMIIMLLISFAYGIGYLATEKESLDHRSAAFASVGLMFGLMGIATGAFWARFTWGTFWTADPKLNGAAVAVLMYIAYQILRSAVDDPFKRARLASVYNIFAFPIFIVLILVLPKLADFSLHPGSGDTVGFNTYDLDNDLRKVFYPAVLGWILTGIWISNVRYRLNKLVNNKMEWKSTEELLDS